MICKEVFKLNDIRGLYKEEITEELAFLIGRAFAKLAKEKVIVGYDSRTSSKSLHKSLIDGLVKSGIGVIDLGLITTPMLYYAREYLDEPYAIMVTASHLDDRYNGFKLCDKDGAMFGTKIIDLMNIVLENNFEELNGNIKEFNIYDEYENMILDKIKLGDRNLKVVVDSGNGTTSNINPKIIEKLGCEVVPLYCEINPSFPNHVPNPAVKDNMTDLSKKVLECGADIGIAFDGDGDRIGIVDEKGNIIKGDILMIMILKSIAKVCKNKLVAFDVSCSNSLTEFCEKLYLEHIIIPSGHSYMKYFVKNNDCDFAGESSGHFYFNDEFYGYDDALYVACRILRILSFDKYPVSAYFNDIPSYYSTDTMYITLDDNNYEYIIEQVKNYAESNKYDYTSVDGIRISYTDGFALIRKSNTTNSLCVRFEGKTLELMETYRLEIMKLINKEL